MSNEMMIPNGKPQYLAKRGEAGVGVDEFLGGVSGGMPLPILSVRGKEFRLRFQGQEMNTRSREIEVVLVASRPHVSKRFFAQSYSSGETVAPDCTSTDGITPDVPEPVNDKCATCQKNAWGSLVTASGKQAKECNDYKRLVVLPIINGQMSQQACVLDVAATSLKSPKGYKGNELFLREYLSTLQRHDLPPTAVVTKLMFTDAEYPQLCFGFSRFAEENEFDRATALREEPDVQTVLEANVAEAPAKIEETDTSPVAANEPAAKPEPEASKETPLEAEAFMWHDDKEEGEVVYTQERYDALKGEGFDEITKKMYKRLTGGTTQPAVDQSKAEDPEPQAQPEPQESTQAAEGGEDIMGEVEKLLKGMS